jgi:hypothetical protein
VIRSSSQIAYGRKNVVIIPVKAFFLSFRVAFSNSADRCIGELETDDEGDFWADHDEDCHGRIEDLREEFPEGFIWSCCNARGGESDGCEIGHHQSPLHIAKKQKYIAKPILTCVRCEEEYTGTENENNACSFHPGKTDQRTASRGDL